MEKADQLQEEIGKLTAQLEDLLNVGREKSTMLSNISQLNDDFSRRLVAVFPDLNERERRLAELVRLNLSTPEIALLLHVSQESVTDQLTKLSERIKVAEGEDVYLVVANV